MRSFFRRRTILILFLLTACGTTQTPPPAPTTVATPSASPTLIPTLPPTQTATPIPQAYFCVNVDKPTPVAGCTIPSAQERDRYCAGRSPYTLIAVPAGETYEVITPNFTCTDNGIRNNNHILSCTGPQSYGFQIKVCNAGCATTSTQQNGPTGYCTQGFNYSLENKCCLMPSFDASGCLTLKFGTRSCGG